MSTSRRSVLTMVTTAVVLIGGMFLYSGRARAEDSQNFSLTASILGVDGTPNTTPTRYIMTTDATDAKSRDMYDIYAENVTSSFVINQTSSTGVIYKHVAIRPMMYWVCPIDAPVIPASPLVATAVPPRCQQIDFRQQSSFNLTFQYRAPNKILHGQVTDETGKPLASSLTGSLFYVFANPQLTTGYSAGTDRFYTWTDTAGNYLMAVGDTGGTFRVGVSPTSKDYLQVPGATQDMIFANDTTVENQELNFVVPKAGTSVIQGRIVDKHGQPIPGFSAKASLSVYAYQTTTPFAGSYITPGTDGKFSIKLVAGTYNVFVNYLPFKGDGDRINFPTQLVTIADGQTLDIGDLFPQKEIVIDPNQTTTPPLVSVNGNERIVVQNGTAKSARFTDGFSTLSYVNQAQTSGVKWANGSLSMNAVSATASGFRLNSLVNALTSAVSSATIVSRSVTPKYLAIKSVTLAATQTVTGTGKISYSVSPNGTDWLTVVPGIATALPTTWNTANGLRWRATLQRSSSADTVSLSDVQLIYTYQAAHAAPRVTSVGIKRQGTTMKLTVRGKNLASGAALYVGGRKVVTTVKNGVVSATIQRNAFPKRSYQVTVVNPDLQYSTTAKMNVLVAR